MVTPNNADFVEKNWVEKFMETINTNNGMIYSTDKDYLITFNPNDENIACHILNNKTMKEYVIIIETDSTGGFYYIPENDDIPVPLVECKFGSESDDWEYYNDGTDGIATCVICTVSGKLGIVVDLMFPSSGPEEYLVITVHPEVIKFEGENKTIELTFNPEVTTPGISTETSIIGDDDY